jgi:tRNA (guanine-N7-)-methyltransferase
MFPDPWPKTRHAKRRFVHPELLNEIARVLKNGGEWRIASDDPTYQQWTDEVIAAQSKLKLLFRTETRPEGWPPTRYEAKAIAAGRQPVYWALEKL